VREAPSTFSSLRVERAVVRDMPDGRPLPPLGAGWHRVRRLPDAHTLWRRLRLFDTND
jgi:hypothetical protein